MEDMDIDLVLEIPDTPDRLPTRRMNIGNCVQEESSSSVAGRLGGSASVSEESLYRLTGKDRLLIGNRHNREHNIHPRRGFVNAEEMECPKNTIVLSSPENAQGSAPLFRKTTMEKSRNSFRGQHMDKGKAHSTMLPFKSSRSQEDNANLDLMEQNVQKRVLEMAPPQDGLKNCLPEGRREGQLPRNSGSYLRNCSNTSATSGDHSKGKEKIDEYGSKNIGPVMVHGKGTSLSNGSSLRAEKPFPTSQHSLVPPKATVKKRLVRHGCISPQNIAIRTKQSNEQSQNSSKAEQNSGNMVSSSPSMTDIREIIAGDNVYSKGKQVVHPQTSKDHDMNLIDLCSSPMSINGKATGSSDSARDARIEENGGWRSTHNHSKNGDRAAVRHFYRFDDVGRRAQNENRVVKRDNFNRENSSIGCDHSDNQGPTEPSRATMLPKRQKKRVFGSRSCGESSRFIPNDSDLVILGSSRESSGSRSSSVHIGEHMDVLDLDGSSVMRGANASGIDPANNEESEARARQVEADEMLARELQEQLYDEVPMFGNGEIDENIAWALQQEEDSLLPTSTRSHREPEHRGSTRHSRAQPPLRIGQSSSSRRGVQTRLPTSARMSRLRSRVFNQPRAGPSRSRNFRFPLGMDLDMRLEILEAMEAAIGDADDMGMANNIFRVQRDFTENDYEMLLALDENNHQHGGASTNQINCLPQSKVQSDNFEEACAICLETPTVGETIRHLPCLHKFHKDCIDPWLSRKTSCPICKSSIT